MREMEDGDRELRGAGERRENSEMGRERERERIERDQGTEMMIQQGDIGEKERKG